MNVMDQLKRKRGFTDTETALADHILLHVEDVCSMTIGSLAQVSHCSNSSIIRLCRKLGLDGYRELRIELARELERQRAGMLEVNPDRPFIETSTTTDRASAVATLTKQAVDATYATLSMADVRRAARLLIDARHVAFYAIGDSLSSVETFCQLLYKAGVPTINGIQRGDDVMVAKMLDTRDVVLVVSYSGEILRREAPVLDAIRASRCRTILITSDARLRERFTGGDCVIVLPEGETRADHIATFYSQTCIRYALNCVYAEVFAANYQRNFERWGQMEELGSQTK